MDTDDKIRKRFPRTFSKQMYAEMDANGFPIYRLSVYEDPATRETVFLNSYGTEVYRLEAEKGYDPYVWQTINFPVRFPVPWTERCNVPPIKANRLRGKQCRRWMAGKLKNPQKGKAYGMLPVELAETGQTATVSGKDFIVEFSKTAGTISKLVYGGETIIASATNGPVLNAYRAPTDNHRRSSRKWKEGLADMQSQLKAFRVVATKPKTISIETVRGYFSGNEELFTLETLYTVFGNGIVDVDNRIVPTFSGQIPKIGLKITLPGKFDRLEWYGRGPQENYPDRKHGSEMGIFQSTVADQFVPYVRPQEMGNHEEVRWVALTDAQGNGLLAVAEGSMSFSSLNHTAKQLDAANHTHELKPLDEVVLCLDKQVLGLGNGSCGPGVIDPYTLTAAPTTFRFSLRPASGKESAREKLPHVESIF